MDRVTAVTQDCFSALIQLRQVEVESLPSPELIHQRLRGFVDELLRRASDAGFSSADAQDMAYALVALMDETALSKAEPLRGYWMGNLLQFHFFQENLAGDGFFTRLQTVRNDSRRTEVLRVYGLCLLFGFQGRYRIRGGELELMSLTESVQQDLLRGRKNGEILSPQGERPPETLAAGKRRAPLVVLSAAVVGVALLVYGGLKLTLASSVSSTAADIAASAQKSGE